MKSSVQCMAVFCSILLTTISLSGMGWGGVTQDSVYRGNTELLWAHDFSFFEVDYRVAATCVDIGDHCYIYALVAQVTSMVATDSAVYAGVEDGRVMMTRDGSSWLQLGGMVDTVHALALFRDTLYVGTKSGVRSYMRGEGAWTNPYVGTREIMDFAVSESAIYAAAGREIYKSTGGSQWNRMIGKGIPFTITSLLLRDGVFFAGTERGVYKSVDEGKSWEPVGVEVSVEPARVSTELKDAARPEGANVGRFLRYIVADGVSANDSVTVMEWDSSDVLIRKWKCPVEAGVADDEGESVLTLRSTYLEFGSNPPDYRELDLSNFKYAGVQGTGSIVDPENECLLTLSAADSLLELSARWITVMDAVSGRAWRRRAYTDLGLNKGQRVLLLSDRDLIRGSSLANYQDLSISNLMAATTPNISVRVLAGSPLSSNTLFVAAEDGVHRSTDAGASWTLQDAGLTNTDVQMVTTIQTSGSSFDLYAGTAGGLFLSTNEGGSFVNVSGGMLFRSQINVLAVDPNDPDHLYAGGGYGVYHTTDVDDGWHVINQGLASSDVTAEHIESIKAAFEDSTPRYRDRGIFQVITESFGGLPPYVFPGVDDDTRIFILLLNIRDDEDPWGPGMETGEGVHLPGYFYPRNESPVDTLSSQREIIFLDIKDATQQEQEAALAHQFHRLLHWGWDHNEERWVSEALAYVAEFACGYPLPDIGEYTNGLSDVLDTPLNSWGPLNLIDEENILHYWASAALFGMYLYEQYERLDETATSGEDFIVHLMQEEKNGFKGIEEVLTEYSFVELFQDWVLANYLNSCGDDTVITLDGEPVDEEKYCYRNLTFTRVIDGRAHDQLEARIINSPETNVEELNNWATDYAIFEVEAPRFMDLTWDSLRYKLNLTDESKVTVFMVREKHPSLTAGDTVQFRLDSHAPNQSGGAELEMALIRDFFGTVLADSTDYTYNPVRLILCHHDTVTHGTIAYVHSADFSPPQASLSLLQNPLFDEFIDVYVFSEEELHEDVEQREGGLAPIKAVIESDTLDVTMTQFLNEESLYIYQGEYILPTEEGTAVFLLPKPQDISGNENPDVVDSISISFRLTPVGGGTLASADGFAIISLPPNALSESRYLSVVEARTGGASADSSNVWYASFGPYVPALQTHRSIGRAYRFGPLGLGLRLPATIHIRYAPKDVAGCDFSELGVYRLEGQEWVYVGGRLRRELNEIIVHVDRLATYQILAGPHPRVDGPGLPRHFELSQNYPNPFNPSTTMPYALPAMGESGEGHRHATLKIFNVVGQEVRTLVDGPQQPGYHRALWDGRDDLGAEVASGIYFYRLKSGDFTATRRMVIIK